ncbi:hypothetical protein [Achromobacter sp. Marseille-Q4962]|uniref:hypothetical protein n=1 Tax=Achromobacter sp. Marseille-Q4962 TaxID=2942202 RepID=UPI002073B3EC|nr:hypothetical protein [Achromobacter sp. Marseille-Q4962]
MRKHARHGARKGREGMGAAGGGARAGSGAIGRRENRKESRVGRGLLQGGSSFMEGGAPLPGHCPAGWSRLARWLTKT